MTESISSKGIALVTGASGGIGALYADRLAGRGYDLVLVARSADRLAAVADAIRAKTGRAVETLVADLTDPAALDRVAARLDTDAAVTLLVNNAGSTLRGGVLDNDARTISALLALNVTAPTVLAAAAGRAFAAKGRGTIVNIASVLAFMPEGFDAAYTGSKAHVLNLSLSLGAQLKDAGVHVQAVLPGATRTDIWNVAGVDIDAALPGRVMEADVMVDAALAGLDRGELVTIPPLADEALFGAWNDARLALHPHLSQREAAPRYQGTATAA